MRYDWWSQNDRCFKKYDHLALLHNCSVLLLEWFMVYQVAMGILSVVGKNVLISNTTTINWPNPAWFQQDGDYEIMLGHYFLFLSHLNRCLFTFGSVLMTKWENASSKKAQDIGKGLLFVEAFSNMMYPIMIWLCIKYGYHFPLEILLFGVANLIQPISYFFRKFGYGKLMI